MDIQCDKVRIRPWQYTDKHSLVRHANNREIWRNLADAFPHPYTSAHAEQCLAMVLAQQPVTSWAIAQRNQAIGSVGINLKHDIYRKTAEFGYWLAQEYRGQGIMSAVIPQAVPYIFRHFDLIRLESPVFSWNQASMQVLEKSGFVQEAVHKKAVYKDGVVGDLHIYVRLHPDFT